MARQNGKRRVYPWAILSIIGLLTTADGGPGTELTGWLILAGGGTMMIRAIRRNSAERRAASTPAQAGGQAAQRYRRSPAARRLRQLIRLLP